MTKQQIFVAAHKLAKTFEGNYSACFSLALKTIYKEMNMTKEVIALKQWFINKHEDKFILEVSTFEIKKETEKAYQLTANSKYGVITLWAPKSVCLDHAEYCAEQNAKFNRYDAIIKFAKDNGVKGVRNRMKLKTVLAKIEAAGLKFVA